MNSDVYIRVKFKTTGEGGRKSPIRGVFYGCPMIIEGAAYDCRLLIDNAVLDLGSEYEVPVKFLNKNTLMDNLKVGIRFFLWEGKEVAEGEIIRLCDD